MKNFKKILTILCILCILLTQNLLFVNVSAESSPTIEVSSVTAQAGEEENIEVTISLANNPGIVSMLLTVNFGDGLTLKQVNDAGVLGSTMHNPSLTSPYCLSWANDTSTTDFTANGTIVTFVFDYTGEKSGRYSTPITVSYDPDNDEIYNKDMKSVYFGVENGAFSICYHTNVEVLDAVAPTCTEKGLTEGKVCKDCKAVIATQEEISALDHDYSTEWTVDKEATCKEEGSKSHHCTRCDAKTDITVIPTSAHTEVIDEAKAATCTEKGLTEGKHCSVCNTVIVVQEETQALGHKYTSEVKKVATCTEKGVEILTCSVCGDISIKEIPALGHKEVVDEAKVATCTDTGLTEGKHCSVCNTVIVAQQEIPALDHDYSNEWTVDKEATCKEEGSKSHHCTRCDAKTDITVIPTSAHTEVIDEAKAATCTEKGLTEGKHCSVCNTVTVVQQEIAAKGHTEVVDEAKEATCTEKGLTEGKHCSVCSLVIVAQEEIAAKGHKYASKITKEATCTEKGEEVFTCSVCGDNYTNEIAAKGHQYTSKVTKEATCTEKGEAVFTCSACDYSYTDEIAAKGHQYTSKVTKEATCTEKGEVVFTCSVCNYTYTDEIPALGHTEVVDEAKAATCTEKGLTEGKHCSVCNLVIVAQEEIPTLDHVAVVDEAKVATCTEKGLTEGKHCSVCNTVIVAQEEIPAKGHTEVVDEAKAATCTEKGLTEGKHCSVCNTVIVVQEETQALGHKYTSEVKKVATCTEKGEEVFTCSVCGDSYTKEIAAKGHKVVVDKAVAPTCTKSGLTEGKHCSVCKAVIVAQKVVKAKGHKIVYKNVKKATYFAKGYTGDKYCTVCKKTISKGKVLPKLILKAPKFTVKASKGQLKVTYKKATDATGYQIKYTIGKKSYIKTYKSSKAASKVYNKLKAGTYKVYVRSFVKQSGKIAYSAWSKEKTVKVK